MSDNKIFSRSKPSELLQELDHIDKKSRNASSRRKTVVKKIISNITISNNEMVNLFKEMIRLYETSDDDLEMKRLLCFYFVTYSALKPEFGDKALELLYKDLRNHSTAVTTLALKTISSINLKLPQLVDTITRILSDKDKWSVELREKACFAVAKVFEFDAKLASDGNLLKLLNDQLYDPQISIVTTALAALTDITERNPTLQLRINKDHALNLIECTSKCNEWSVIYILNSLMSFIPQTNEEALMMIDKVLPILQHGNSSVVLNALKVIVYNCNYAVNPEDVIPTLPKRLGNALVSMLSKPPEIQFLVLRNIILLLLSKPNLIDVNIRAFFCQYDNPIYVKDTKLEIIYLLADETNIDVVLEELQEYATEVDITMSRKAIRAIGNLAVKLDACHLKCIEVLDDLVSNGISYIVQEAAIVLKNILRKYRVGLEDSIANLIDHAELIDEPESKQSLIWIVGNYSPIIPKAPLLLEDFGANFEEEPVDFQLAFLTAVVKYYLLDPSKEASELAVRFLKIGTEYVNNPDLRERAYMYWRLISANDMEMASSLVNSSLPIISTENEKLDRSILEELELNVGSLASIYLKPVNQVFRLAKAKRLPASPALQPKSVGGEKKKSNVSASAVPPTAVKSPDLENSDQQRAQFHDTFTEPLRKNFQTLSTSSSPMKSSSASTSSGNKLGRKLSLSFKKTLNR